ncbi:MAG: fibrobacter succinogenes major paralogous domain-containing protein [Bacteroidales bacterium]|jgi:uncharacterized protein (TIGR02145 family)|nr:fibrobacter succinogenes major paralogous domain-containing protein [Bacteroidales bacterium]MDD4385574.1 fibrobacter succinogenes major paralogous domain-containing protein [Bacteroidales bacterium]
MIKKTSFLLYALIMGLLVLSSSCKKDDANVLAVLTTAEVTGIMRTTAVSGGDITDDGGAAIIIRGVCWSTNETPTINDSKTVDGDGIGSFTSNIKDLEANTTYYVRAYAVNSVGTNYGNAFSFTTKDCVDGDGNIYETVIIGNQTWMAENLKTTKYSDGLAIPLVTDKDAWLGLTTPGYCWYDHDLTSHANIYGALYNWYTVNTDKLCPTGWHAPTNADWTTLITYLGGAEEAGGKLKESGTTHWDEPNQGATNESGFTALPGGMRYNGVFSSMRRTGQWWTATQDDTHTALAIYLDSAESDVMKSENNKTNGFSVRCVKN